MAAGLQSCTVGEQSPSDAPAKVPGQLIPPGYRAESTPVLLRGYTADGGTCDHTECEKELFDTVREWYGRRLGASVVKTNPDEGVIAFRRYNGRYTGEVELEGAGTRMRSRVVEMGVRVTLKNPGGSLTRVPDDFPLHPDMNEDSDTPPSLLESYCVADVARWRVFTREEARQEARQVKKAIAFYRRTLGDSIWQQEPLGGGYSFDFDAFQGVSGSVVVQGGCVDFDLRRPLQD